MIDPTRKANIRKFLAEISMEGTDLELVNLSMTHRSYSFEKGLDQDNERLEFLGDAFLGLQVSRYLYDKYPELDEGALSKRKSRLVSRSMLGRLARSMGIAPLLLLGKGEDQTGGRRRSTLLGSTLEALIGAFYLSSSLKKVSRFLMQQVIEPSEHLLDRDLFADYKSRLQEIVQKRYRCVPEYKVISETGPDHKKRFRVVVQILGKTRGTGFGMRKKTAENEAAHMALDHLEHESPTSDWKSV